MSRLKVEWIYEEGEQPCAYCWNPPEDWVDRLWEVDQRPYGDGWRGFADTHKECYESMLTYMEERERDGFACKECYESMLTYMEERERDGFA